MSGYEERASLLRGSEEIIFKLVCEGATPGQWRDWLRAPLEHAANQGQQELVEKLLRAGAGGKAGWRGCGGRTLLDAAAEGGSEAVVSAFLDAGAEPDLNVKTAAKKRTALHRAAAGGHRDAARALMVAGADVNVLDADKDSPLHLAVCDGNNEQLALDLLLRGAQPGAKNAWGNCPLHHAAWRGHDQTVRALLRKGVDVNVQNNQRSTPLHVAARAGHVATAKILIAAGARVANRETFGDTPLHLAAEENRTGAVQALVEAGADIEARGKNGKTPLHGATFLGSCEAMLALLRHGANVQASTNRGSSPLHLACMQGKADAADVLLRWGADETAVNIAGRTASHKIPLMEDSPAEDRAQLERLARLMSCARQDRAWRRRGFLVMCRAMSSRVRPVFDLGTSDGSVGPQERLSGRLDGWATSVDGTDGDAVEAGFAAVVARIVDLEEEGVFRHILEYVSYQ